MVAARQTLNGLRDLITPLSGIVCHQWADTCYDQPTYQTEVSSFTHYEDVKGDTKYLWFVVVRVHSRSLQIAQFDTAPASSY